MQQSLIIPMHVMTNIQELLEMVECDAVLVGITESIFVFELVEADIPAVNGVLAMAMELFDAEVRLN